MTTTTHNNSNANKKTDAKPIAKKQISMKWLIIFGSVLIVAIGVLAYFLVTSQNNEKEESVEVLLQDYEELESAYSKALMEMEIVSKKEYDDIDEMKKDMMKTLEKIKKEKDKIVARRGQVRDSLYQDRGLTPRIDSIVIVNEAGKSGLSQEEIDELLAMNKELKSQNEEMEQNLMSIRNYFEREKSKNSKLNAKITALDEQLEKIEKDGSNQSEKLKQLQEDKKKLEKQLKSSNQTINKQNSQINSLVQTLRKANVSAYYIYEKGNKEKQAKIFLTQSGISKVYLNYFKKNQPVIYFDFELNEALFNKGIDKAEFTIYNSANHVVHSESRVISKQNMQIVVPANKFEPGSYYLTLMRGNENLIIGGKYNFKLQ